MDYRLSMYDRPTLKDSTVTLFEEGLMGINLEIDKVISILDLDINEVADRSCIDLLEFAPFLNNMCLVDFVFEADGQMVDAVGRFVGGDIGSVYGEMTGKSLKTLPSTEASERAFEAFERILELKKPVVGIGFVVLPSNVEVRIDILYLPLSEDGHLINGALMYIGFTFPD